MSSFTKSLIVEVLDKGTIYKIAEEFTYYRSDDKNSLIKVPKGFKTNFASIPRLFWNIYPPTGGGTKGTKYGKSAVLHDYLYETKMYNRKECDKIFLEAMKAMEVNFFTRYLFYYCVRLFGKKNYG